MTVPTKKEFEEYLSLLDGRYTQELEDKLQYLRASYPEVSSAISEINTQRKKVLNKLRSSPVYLWLDNQYPYKLAMRSLNRKVKYITLEKSFESEVNDVLKILKKRDGHEYGRILYSRRRRYIDLEKSRPIIEALLVYFYGGSIESIIQFQKDEELLPLRVKKVLEELDKHFDNPLRLEVERPAGLELFQLSKKTRDTFYTAITRCLHFLHQPIKRNDEASRERLLVFNLYMGLIQPTYDAASNATAITHLLRLEGIEGHLGQRSIEKLIQKRKPDADGHYLNRP